MTSVYKCTNRVNHAVTQCTFELTHTHTHTHISTAEGRERERVRRRLHHLLVLSLGDDVATPYQNLSIATRKTYECIRSRQFVPSMEVNV